MWSLLYIYALETTRTRSNMPMIRTVLDATVRLAARIWNRTVPQTEQTSDSSLHYSPAPQSEGLDAAPLLRGADMEPDRASAPKTAALPTMSDRLSPSRAAPRPPSRHRPGTPLSQAQRSCVDAGPDAELCQQGGALHQTERQNITGSQIDLARPVAEQNRCLSFIQSYLAENGAGPSYAEIMKSARISSKSRVHRHVWALVKQGKLAIIPGRRRAITIPVEDGHEKR